MYLKSMYWERSKLSSPDRLEQLNNHTFYKIFAHRTPRS
ncbi:hypothetical protein VHARVF571_40011 [Vibrio harveyi]|nr:hypothetical protein VHARVF571_40011 [Vibrio harveyi]